MRKLLFICVRNTLQFQRNLSSRFTFKRKVKQKQKLEIEEKGNFKEKKSNEIASGNTINIMKLHSAASTACLYE